MTKRNSLSTRPSDGDRHELNVLDRNLNSDSFLETWTPDWFDSTGKVVLRDRERSDLEFMTLFTYFFSFPCANTSLGVLLIYILEVKQYVTDDNLLLTSASNQLWCLTPHLKSNFDLDDNEYRMQACCVRKGSSWFTTTWVEASNKSRQPFPFTARIGPSSRSGLFWPFVPKRVFGHEFLCHLNMDKCSKGH